MNLGHFVNHVRSLSDNKKDVFVESRSVCLHVYELYELLLLAMTRLAFISERAAHIRPTFLIFLRFRIHLRSHSSCLNCNFFFFDIYFLRYVFFLFSIPCFVSSFSNRNFFDIFYFLILFLISKYFLFPISFLRRVLQFSFFLFDTFVSSYVQFFLRFYHFVLVALSRFNPF